MLKKQIGKVVLSAAAAAMLLTGAPLFASDADNGIEASFRNSYVYKTYLKDDSVNVEAKDGVVTLSGTVSDDSNKIMAQDTAANLPGVTRVDNRLMTKAEAAAERSDAWIVRKIQMALLFHRNVSYSKTTVESKDGVVTLKGEASSVAQKELTGEYAKDIAGVKEVKNEMTVVETPATMARTVGGMIDDASITAQVKAALSTHRSTSAMTTKVMTRGGVVTLTGIAKNAAEKSLVTKIVTDIKGVTSVRNEMTIEPTSEAK